MYLLIFILAGIAVLASPAPAPAASITPAAVLPREDQQIFGWYSDAVTNGDTICTYLFGSHGVLLLT